MTFTRLQHGILFLCGVVLSVGSAFTPLGPLLGPVGAKIAIGAGFAMAAATNLTKVMKGDKTCPSCAGTGIVLPTPTAK